MLFINGKKAAPTIANQQDTDFTKVTARPEFVAEGKYFYDETGTLRVGTSKYLSTISEETK